MILLNFDLCVLYFIFSLINTFTYQQLMFLKFKGSSTSSYCVRKQ